MKRQAEMKSILTSKKTTEHTKKSLSFAKSIEVISYFAKSDSPRQLSKDKLYIQDVDDKNLKSVSSRFLIPDHWSLKLLPKISPYSNFNVILDQVYLENSNLRISILTKNLAFEKHVTTRYTINNWKDYHDIDAVFQNTVGESCGTYCGVDRFCSQIDFRSTQGQEVHVEFAMRYIVNGQEYWDNNNGENYKVNKSLNQVILEKKIGYSCQNADTEIPLKVLSAQKYRFS
jgi:hypothetical protein